MTLAVKENNTLENGTNEEIISHNEVSLDFQKKVLSLYEALLDSLDYDLLESLKNDDEEKLKLYLRHELKKIIENEEKENIKKKKENSEKFDQTKLIGAVLDELLGFGPVEELLRDASVTDIFVNSPDVVFAERRGKVEKTNVRFLDHEHVYRLVQRVASKSGRHLDLGTPYLDSHLPDGSRLHAIIPPVALNGIKVSIRKFLFQKLSINSLVEKGGLTQQMVDFIQLAVRSRFNIVVCGGTGSGKTTFLNCLLDSVREGERVITIEDTPELEPTHGHIVRLLTRAANSEGRGGVSQADLMINALRMRPDRVILGELRGPEAFNLLHAMNTGQDGSMVTLHASGPEEVIPRLLNMILMAKTGLSSESVREQIGGALDLIVNVARLVDGSRRVMAISQVSSLPEGGISIDDIFRYEIEEISEEGLKGHFAYLAPHKPRRFLNKVTTSGLKKKYLEILPEKPDRCKDN